MAVNKRKVLDAARKYAQKGAKEKALKEYHRLLKLDPRDAKLHLEIGDCYRRWGQLEEAATQYSRVAEQYKEDGFDARAVAVFKQILNIDAKRYTAYVSLAELYQRMGLDAEALGALQAAADGYHKDGQRREALDLLRRMATLDPTNTTSRLKVAELLRQEGMEDDALSEYEQVAVELKRQGATEQFITVQERVLELCPERTAAMLAIAHGLIELKSPERAEPFARRALDQDPGDSDIHELLGDIYKSLGNDVELAKTTRELVKIYRERGDEDKARELTQRIPTAFEFDPEAPAAGADVTESEFLGDDELLDDDFLDSDGPGADDELQLEADEELDLDLDGSSAAEQAAAEADLTLDEPSVPEPAEEAAQEQEPAEEVAKEPLPEGDPDQLLAEASVYLRYGKGDQAIASLKGILAKEPDHRAALEKLGEAYAAAGNDEAAVAAWSHAAQQAKDELDESGFQVLRDRIAAIDADAAAALMGSDPEDRLSAISLGEEADEAPTAESNGTTAVEGEGAIPFEMDLDSAQELSVAEDEFETASEDDAYEISQEAVPDLNAPSESTDDVSIDVITADSESRDDSEFEIDIDVEADELEVEADDVDVDAAPEADTDAEVDTDVEVEVEVDADAESDVDVEIDVDVEVEVDVDAAADDLDLDVDDVDVDVDVETDVDDEMAADSTDRVASADGNTTGSARVSEDLEEAEFYYQQELFDEAEAVYRRILKIAPNHPSALLRLGELAEARGDSPSEIDSGVSEPVREVTDAELDEMVAAADEATAAEAASAEEEPPAEDEDAVVEADVTDPTLDLSAPAVEDGAQAPTGEDSTEVQELDGADTDEGDEAVVRIDPPARRHSLADDTVPYLDSELDARSPEPAAPAQEAEPVVAARVDAEVEFDVEVDVESGAEAETEAEVETEVEVETEAEADVEVEAESDVEDEAEEADDGAEAEESGDFDLGAELRDVFEDDSPTVAEPGDAATSATVSTVEDGFESIFADFKQGVSATLGEDDYETRYDLGIAYREMELYDDAIGEFQRCLQSPSRKLASLHMMGLCALDLGRANDAANHFQQALAVEGVPTEQQAAIHFDLARAFEADGDIDRARTNYEAAIAADPELPGVGERLDALGEAVETPIELADQDSSEETDYESFDDLMADANAEQEDEEDEAPAETFESFDDVISEAEADEPEIPEAEVEPEPDEVVAPPEVAETSDAPNDGSAKPRRRKKISFV